MVYSHPKAMTNVRILQCKVTRKVLLKFSSKSRRKHKHTHHKLLINKDYSQ